MPVSRVPLARRIRHHLEVNGVRGTAAGVVRRLTRRPLAAFDAARPRVSGRVGLEIGGPSPMFARSSLMPIYPTAARVDNTNFGATTLWEGAIDAGRTFRFDPAREPGTQFLFDATDLAGIADCAYDFVLSCHSLEHVANPLKALAEWRRVVRAGGTLVLILPHKDGTFDRRRPTTTLDHLREDRARDVREDDLTHLPEVLALHDLTRDHAAGDAATFTTRCEQNAQHRGMHHHTFTTGSAIAMLREASFRVVTAEAARPFHIVLVAERVANDRKIDNSPPYLAPTAAWRPASPFPSDRA